MSSSYRHVTQAQLKSSDPWLVDTDLTHWLVAELMFCALPETAVDIEMTVFMFQLLNKQI